MFNTLAMIVLEKTREISILRSMGYTRRDISRIFLWQGAIVLAAGTVLGWAFGAAVTFGVSHLPIRIRRNFFERHVCRLLVGLALRHGSGNGVRRRDDREPHPRAPRRAPRAGRCHPGDGDMRIFGIWNFDFGLDGCGAASRAAAACL